MRRTLNVDFVDYNGTTIKVKEGRRLTGLLFRRQNLPLSGSRKAGGKE